MEFEETSSKSLERRPYIDLEQWRKGRGGIHPASVSYFETPYGRFVRITQTPGGNPVIVPLRFVRRVEAPPGYFPPEAVRAFREESRKGRYWASGRTIAEADAASMRRE